MDYTFKRHRADKIPRESLLKILENFAKQTEYFEFTRRDFVSAGVSSQTVRREFGGWRQAMLALQNYLKSKNIVLKPRRRKDAYSEAVLFAEMGRVWKDLGHRPSKGEWQAVSPAPTISYQSYKRHFGGWQNACLRFLEHKMGGNLTIVEKETGTILPTTIREPGKTRTIPLRLRLKVLERDGFRCIMCGRSPAITPGIVLHLDHKIPFSKGGPSTAENLQTLCGDCNLGKGDQQTLPHNPA